MRCPTRGRRRRPRPRRPPRTTSEGEADRPPAQNTLILSSRRTASAVVRTVWLVVGLGNPGPRTPAPAQCGLSRRRRAGLALGGWFRWHKFGRAEVVEGRLGRGGPRLVLARAALHERVRRAVRGAVTFYKVPPDARRSMTSLTSPTAPPDQARRGDNGHNGLRSIRPSLGTGEFYRVRVGIGRPPGRQDPADFVLADFSRPSARSCPSRSRRPPTRRVAGRRRSRTDPERLQQLRGLGCGTRMGAQT